MRASDRRLREWDCFERSGHVCSLTSERNGSEDAQSHGVAVHGPMVGAMVRRSLLALEGAGLSFVFGSAPTFF